MGERRQEPAGPARGPGGRPVQETGLTVAELDLHGGPGFKEEVERFAADTGLGDLVERVLAQGAPPRRWAVLDRPGATAARAAAALALARELSRRGQGVLVVDADERHPDLTRWAGRHEREGWVDMMRYGTSLAASSVPLPWEGRGGRLVGIGSFVPAEAEPLQIERLLRRLGGMAEDVVVCAPLAERSAPWLDGADLRLLCWDRLETEPEAMERLVAAAAAAGAPIDWLLAFGPASLAEAGAPSGAAAPGASVPETGPADRVADGAAAASRPTPDEPAPGPRPPEPAPAGASAEAPAAPPGAAAGRRERGSSRPFWLVAAALAVLIVVVGAWYFGVARRPGPSAPTLAPPGGGADIARSPAVSGPARSEPATASIGSAAETAPVPVGGAPAGGPADGAAPETDVPAVGVTGPAADERPAVPVAAGEAPGAADSAGAGGAVAAADTSRGPAPAPPGATGWPAAFREPVGAGGWALHVYSLADTADAAREIAELRALGLRAASRAVQLPGRGRWYRVYVGSFATREEALAAAPELLRRLHHDYAMPARF